MQSASTLGEPPIPLLSQPAEGQREPAPESPAQAPLTPEAVASVHAALLRLAALWVYVTIMTLLGYRMRRRRKQRATRPAQPPTRTSPAAPPKPRRKHRYMDQEMCARMLAGINSQVGDAMGRPATPVGCPAGCADPTDASAPTPTPSPGAAPANRASQHAPNVIPLPRRAPLCALAAAPCARATLRPHPPPFSKPRLPPSPTHTQFVAMS